jgi:hypothetical protein
MNCTCEKIELRKWHIHHGNYKREREKEREKECLQLQRVAQIWWWEDEQFPFDGFNFLSKMWGDIIILKEENSKNHA